jgi:hypothetical protein
LYKALNKSTPLLMSGKQAFQAISTEKHLLFCKLVFWWTYSSDFAWMDPSKNHIKIVLWLVLSNFFSFTLWWWFTVFCTLICCNMFEQMNTVWWLNLLTIIICSKLWVFFTVADRLKAFCATSPQSKDKLWTIFFIVAN